jgi:hypothetical protein
LDTIIDRLLHKSLLTALTSIGNNDGDVIDDNISISLLNIKGIYSDET